MSAQHFGLPTRLLDWTLNPLVALWFVVRSPGSVGKSGTLWVYKCAPSDFTYDRTGKGPFATRRIAVFRPQHVSERIRAQSGYFTVHTLARGRFLPFEKTRPYSSRLTKLSIDGELYAEFRYRLDQVGINQSGVFPDLDGLCGHIQWLHTFLDDEDRLRRDTVGMEWSIRRRS
jgi:hypothetical protein